MSRTLLVVALLLAAVPASFAAADVSHYPAAGHPWTKRDYLDFYFAHFNGNRALPHLRSAENRALFDRIVDERNLAAILRAPTAPVEKKRHLAMILGTMGEIRAAYHYAAFVGEPLHEELTRIQFFMLDILIAMNGLPPGDETSQSRESWRTIVFGVVRSLSERNIYSPQQIARLSQALASAYPNLKPVFDDASRRQLRSQITELASKEHDGAISRELAHLLKTIE